MSRRLPQRNSAGTEAEESKGEKERVKKKRS
ncbi:hypothetical protein E2C01_081656 [Portunus trituberculatus]|uniref:Uncharacterized protein n=1 Tax=Portunus trituberculatus TaxID=210409 RepID=A0A5B7IQC4_PORTR|nr:hypothetical protein [Portunus trituberculatus]